jgi:hypothetical protein
VGGSAVAHFAGFIAFLLSTWGLRPRLYAVTRFAGYTVALCCYLLRGLYRSSMLLPASRAIP